MPEKTLSIKSASGSSSSFKHITLDVYSERIYMNEGVALMPFMKEEYYFLELAAGSGFNDIETDFVEYKTVARQKRAKKVIESIVYQ